MEEKVHVMEDREWQYGHEYQIVEEHVQ